MIIDAISGNLTIGDLSVSPLTTLSELSPWLDHRATRLMLNGDFVSYSASFEDNTALTKCTFGATLLFQAGCLLEINLGIISPNSSWSDWSEADELRKKGQMDQILALAVRGPLGEYPWGEIISDFSMRDRTSTGIIRYKK